LRERTLADEEKMRSLARFDLEREDFLNKTKNRMINLRNLKESNQNMSTDDLNELYNLEQRIGPIDAIDKELNNIALKKEQERNISLIKAKGEAAQKELPYGDTEAGFKLNQETERYKADKEGVSAYDRKYINTLNKDNFMGKYGITDLNGMLSSKDFTKEEVDAMTQDAASRGLNVYFTSGEPTKIDKPGYFTGSTETPTWRISSIVPSMDTSNNVNAPGKQERSNKIDISKLPPGTRILRNKKTGEEKIIYPEDTNKEQENNPKKEKDLFVNFYHRVTPEDPDIFENEVLAVMTAHRTSRADAIKILQEKIMKKQQSSSGYNEQMNRFKENLRDIGQNIRTGTRSILDSE